MNTIDYGKTFALMRDGCPSEWQEYIHHPFVRGLGDGTLPKAAYLHYMVQDYVYLVHYSRAWALGVIKAETAEEMRLCAATVDALINRELALHVKTCAAQGVNEDALFNAEEEIENIAYTRYVIDSGLQGDFLDLLLTLAPCTFGYGEIGLNLKQTLKPGNPYEEWINTYAGEGYQQVCLEVGRLIDSAIERRLGPDPENSPRWKRLLARYSKAVELEANFWSMGLRGGE